MRSYYSHTETVTHFVIVIEVDNKRAAAAYRKGLDDLAVLWPQLEERSAKFEALCRASWATALAKQVAEEQAERQEDAAREAAYRALLENWEKTSPWRRGDKPREPVKPFDYGKELRQIDNRVPAEFRIIPLISSYQGTKQALKRSHDLAASALGPYRMSEGDVHQMIRWEDGSEVERIREALKNDFEPSQIENAWRYCGRYGY